MRQLLVNAFIPFPQLAALKGTWPFRHAELSWATAAASLVFGLTVSGSALLGIIVLAAGGSRSRV